MGCRGKAPHKKGEAMFCRNICVENFRNIESANVEFCPGTNVLIGENAQGKTNLLEAIYDGFR